ncbi:MAG TPA: GDSL-type esterase/lipase family protein [Thermoanaerobaculia bacterium]|nr:GDSL-type esterase/lipase family protein [Thermoanaerobaculia bacterium]
MTNMAKRKKQAIAAGVAAIVAAWLLWPSPYERVKNLASPNSAIISFGDSLTAGYGAGAGEDYPSLVAEHLGVPIENAGVSGDTTSSALARIDTVLANNPRMVIIGLGGNDYLRGEAIATTEANLRTIVKKTQEAGAMVVLLGFSFPSLNANYASMYERVADDESCLLIDGVMKGILTDRTLKSDEIHPNARGYALMAERIAEPVEKLLREANSAR